VKRRILSFAFGLILSGAVAYAHHSISGIYDVNQQITVEGIVKEFHFVNPHPFLIVEVRNAKGSAERWRFEMDNLSELSEAGMKKETFKPGDRIVVSGNPGSAQKLSLYIRKLERPSDGFRYEQVDATPKIRFKPK